MLDMNAIIEFIVIQFWNGLLLALIFFGVYFTIKTRGFQFRKLLFLIGTPGRYLTSAQGKSGVQAYRAFFTHIGSTIGSGAIFGVGVGIFLGGPGAVLWMWVYCLLGMSISMVECTLGQYYKVRSEIDKNEFIGGPAFYARYGAKLKIVGTLFALSMVTIVPIALGLHSNFLSGLFSKTFGVARGVNGIILAILFCLVVIGGITRISAAASFFIPVAGATYLGGCGLILILNITELPAAFGTIFSSAFGLGSAGGGFAGFMLAINHGARRAMYSNGAGQGAGPVVIASAHLKHPAQGGAIGMLGVFIDTLIFCTITALTIITANLDIAVESAGSGGAMLIDAALVQHLQMGSLTTNLLTFVMFCLVFPTIIGIYYFGEAQLRFLKDNRLLVRIFSFTNGICIAYFSVAKTVAVVNFIDIAAATATVFNLMALWFLLDKAVEIIKNYDMQLSKGVYCPEYKQDWALLKKGEIFEK